MGHFSGAIVAGASWDVKLFNAYYAYFSPSREEFRATFQTGQGFTDHLRDSRGYLTTDLGLLVLNKP